MIKSTKQICEKYLFDCLYKLKVELEESFKRDEEFEKKRKILSRIREIEKEIAEQIKGAYANRRSQTIS